MSATAFETKGIIGHGWKFSKSNLKANPGKVIEQIRERLAQRKPVFTKRGLRCRRARAGDGKFAFS